VQKIRQENPGIFAKNCLDLLHTDAEKGQWTWVSLNRIKKLFTRLNKHLEPQQNAEAGEEMPRAGSNNNIGGASSSARDPAASSGESSSLPDWPSCDRSMLHTFSRELFSLGDQLRFAQEQIYGLKDGKQLDPQTELRQSFASMMQNFDEGYVPGNPYILQVRSCTDNNLDSLHALLLLLSCLLPFLAREKYYQRCFIRRFLLTARFSALP
jgi:hypothetical protein